MSDGDTSEEIMGATYRALCAHGYADLTMQDIADESEKSKAALHYHYDSKHDLLCAFLDYLYDGFVERTSDVEGEAPHETLLALVDAVLDKPDDDSEEFGTAILEIRAQAPYEPRFRERLTRFDEYLADELTDILEAGVADGTFDPEMDPDDTARFLVTVLTGAATERVTAGQSVECTRRMLAEYVETHVLAADREVEA
ncbi:TetR/AcrR family transcriptional regulator [Halomicroarcula sp. F13]|uniref:TetR/AcrR family transcriptional regulator n=1 Tax=Haloarcula rubra TaxID=2487747 RepID=A0AAW4PQK1_9EURY|nr:TetR/AcrR family transcriptional regulator [Halomicroarcula rubra]MBX0322693.1 TetR/AcrR family transcriptional regulator [Halomicroarcula rubra]